MSDPTKTTSNRAPGASGPGGPATPKPPFDPEDAKRAAAAALVVGQAGLKAAWKRGKAAAAARGITEETVKQTVERGRVTAMEQARKRGLAGQELRQWPGGESTGAGAGPTQSATRPTGPTADTAGTAGTSAPPSPVRSQRATSPPPPTARATTNARSAAGGAMRAGLGGLAGLGRGRLLGTTRTDAARPDRRIAAFALDLIAFATLFIVVVVVLDLFVGVATGDGPSGSGEPLGLSWDELSRVVTFRAIGDVGSAGTIAAQIVYLFAFVGYMIGGEAHLGRTIGKRLLGLRVVPKRRGRGRIGLQAALIRNLCRIYDILIPLWPLALLDLGLSVLTPSRQRSGDWFAGTIVIDERLERG
jgi:uncharacterized RDD family membrane protein YckC